MNSATGAKVDYADFSDDTTEFVKKLKRVLADINIRVAAVENIKGMVDEFERRYGEVALVRIDAAIAPVLQTMLAGLEDTQAALAALDEDYRTNGMDRVDSIIEPLIASAEAALAVANAQVEALDEFLATKQSVSEKGQANGYAALDATGKVPTGQLPSAVLGAMSYQGTWNASTNTPTIPAASAGNKGYFYKVAADGATNVSGITDWQVGDWIVSNGASWDKIDNTDQVTSVAGKQGAVTLVKADVGLGNVDNTSDANKPVSMAQQTALDGKSATGHTHTFASLTSKPTTLAGYGITDAPNEPVVSAPVTLSGSAVDITGIPSWATQIVININGASTNSSGTALLQLGDSGGVETTGYVGAYGLARTSSVGIESVTTGFAVLPVSATADAVYGSIVLTLFDSATNTWIAAGTLGIRSTPAGMTVGGRKSLSAPLDRIRLQTGEASWDAGTVNIRCS